jgi:hypothetical protein
MFNRFRSPFIQPQPPPQSPPSPIPLTTPISSHTVDIPALPHSLALSAETSNKKKRKSYTFETKQAVHNAVKTDGLKYADAAAQFGIAGGKSAVQNIVKSGPYETLLGFKRQRMVPSCVFEIENRSKVKEDIQGQPDLPEEEAIFLQTFDVGEKFIRGIIERRGLKSIGLHGEGADADEALKLPRQLPGWPSSVKSSHSIRKARCTTRTRRVSIIDACLTGAICLRPRTPGGRSP